MRAKLALILALLAAPAYAQNLSVDLANTGYLVRGIIGEPRTEYLPDTTLYRFVQYAQHFTVVALAANSNSIFIDTVTTVAGQLRYYLAHTPGAGTATDTSMAGRVAAVIYKSDSVSGYQEYALTYVPPEVIGKPQTGEVPAFYSVVGRNLLLGKSPLGGQTLFVYMLKVPADLSSATTKLTVNKEDQIAVALLASSWACMRDNQITKANTFWQMWQQYVGAKGYPQPETQAP